MKKLLLFLVLGLSALSGKTQTNPSVKSVPATVTPVPISGAVPLATFSFTFANTGPTSISNLDVDGEQDPIVILVSLKYGSWDNITYPTAAAAVGGSYASNFTWTFDESSKTFTGVQNQTILGNASGTITIGYRATTGSYDAASAANGANVNLTSNGNAINGPGTNDTSDDNTSAFTYLDAPLPVKLVSFTVQKEGATAILAWRTTEEINAERFEIQRSQDAKSWSSIGSRAAAGESKVLLDYRFTDAAPVSGSNYYRLKMIDRDASFGYSRIQSLDFQGTDHELSLYPNPVSDVFFLKDDSGAVMNPGDIREVSITNIAGIRVFNSTSVSSDGIHVQGLINGMYVAKVTRMDGTASTHKLMISKQ